MMSSTHSAEHNKWPRELSTPFLLRIPPSEAIIIIIMIPYIESLKTRPLSLYLNEHKLGGRQRRHSSQ